MWRTRSDPWIKSFTGSRELLPPYHPEKDPACSSRSDLDVTATVVSANQHRLTAKGRHSGLGDELADDCAHAVALGVEVRKNNWILCRIEPRHNLLDDFLADI
jgi:hypothetical protein